MDQTTIDAKPDNGTGHRAGATTSTTSTVGAPGGGNSSGSGGGGDFAAAAAVAFSLHGAVISSLQQAAMLPANSPAAAALNLQALESYIALQRITSKPDVLRFNPAVSAQQAQQQQQHQQQQQQQAQLQSGAGGGQPN